MALFRRRTVWLPTWHAVVALTLLVALVLVLLARSAYALLACNEPLQGARTLVVEGWMDPTELSQAAALLRQGGYQQVITTGGRLDGWDARSDARSAAERAADFLRASDGVTTPVTAVTTPPTTRDRTYISALAVRDAARAAGTPLTAFDLYTAGVHARRSWRVYRMAFGDSASIGIHAARPARVDGPRWWTTSEGAKRTVDEALSLAWTVCCFWPND